MSRKYIFPRKITAFLLILTFIIGFMQSTAGAKAADTKTTDEILGLSVGVGTSFAAYITNSDGKVLTGDTNKKVSSAKKSAGFDPYQIWHINRIGDNCFTIKNLGTGKYLDVSGSSTASGTNVCMWEQKAEENANQRWRFYDAGNSNYNIKADCTDCVLDVNSTTGAATMQTFINKKQPTQSFTLNTIKAEDFRPRSIRITANESRVTVTWTAAASSMVNGYTVELYNTKDESKPVQTKAGLSGVARTHAFNVTESGTYFVRVYGIRKDYQDILSSYTKSENITGGKSVTAALGTAKNVGKDFYAYITNSSGLVLTGDTIKKVYADKKTDTFNAYQLWNIKSISSNCYTVTNLGTGKNLDVSSSGTEAGTSVIMWEQKSIITSNQKWRFYDAGSSNYVIGSDCTKCVLNLDASQKKVDMQTFIAKTYSMQNFQLDIVNIDDLAPQNVEVTISGKKVSVEWKAAASNMADRYDVKLFNSANLQKPVQEYSHLTKDTRSCVFDNVDKGNYYVIVYGVNNAYPDKFTSSVKSKVIPVKESVEEVLGAPIDVGKGFNTYISSPGGNVLTGSTDKEVYSAKKKEEFDPYQVWYVNRISTDCYTIKNLGTGKYLDVSGSSTLSNTPVYMLKKEGTFTPNQKWRFYDVGNSNYVISSECTDCVLNMSSLNDDAVMQSFVSKSYSQQLFKLTKINTNNLKPQKIKVKTSGNKVTVTWTASKSEITDYYKIEVYSTKDTKKAIKSRSRKAGNTLKITFTKVPNGKYYVKLTGMKKGYSTTLKAAVKSKNFTIK